MKRAVRDQRRALERLLRHRSEEVRAASPAEFLRRMPVREGPPAPPLRRADRFGLRAFKRRARRFFIGDHAVVEAERLDEPLDLGVHDPRRLPRMPNTANPTAPMPSRTRVEGSGTVAIHASTLPEGFTPFPTMIVPSGDMSLTD